MADVSDARPAAGAPRRGRGNPQNRLPLGEAAEAVLHDRYLRCDEAGAPVETPTGMLERVAAAVAAPARRFGEDAGFWEERFRERLTRLELLPSSPTLMNAGLEGGQLAACFVLPIEDDLDSIFSTLHRMARIHQSGGGTGFSFSRLRPRDDRVRSTGGVTSGPVSFLELFDATTALIRRGGRRRGANMGVLRVDHPDVAEFIATKTQPGRLENFNLSIGVTDEFLAALDVGHPFALRNPRTGATASTVEPGRLFEAIVDAAWKGGEPGLLFLDEINRANPTPRLGAIEATNPCGEQPLLPWESCVLGSVNLAAFGGEAGVDWKRLGEAIRDGVVFLDNVIEANAFPFPEIEKATWRTRKIGLGVMGFAELLARLGVPYDSEEGVALGERIAAFLAAEARKASAELGERRGAFPAFAESAWPSRGFSALRNATVTCVAPTGTISLIAGTSSGIEPFFALAVARRALGSRRFVETHAVVAETLGRLGAAGQRALEAIRRTGSIRAVDELPEALRRRFPIALEIEPRFHLRMQAAFQAHVDAAVSKTVNLPQGATPRDVAEAFALARACRLKGVTVYRYGSRADQALSFVEDRLQGECRECAA